MDYQTTAIIRQRGQLTIPKKMLKMLGWVEDEIVVTLQLHDDCLIIKRYTDEKNKHQK